MATIYKTDRTIEQKPMNSLEDFQAAVGGYVEVVGHDEDGNYILANEEGLMIGLPANPFWSWLKGNIVVASPKEFN